jgi:hypothetical protein
MLSQIIFESPGALKKLHDLHKLQQLSKTCETLIHIPELIDAVLTDIAEFDATAKQTLIESLGYEYDRNGFSLEFVVLEPILIEFIDEVLHTCQEHNLSLYPAQFYRFGTFITRTTYVVVLCDDL